MSAIELRRRLGGATFGEVLERLSAEGLPLPRAPERGREAQIARARTWMFPRVHPYDFRGGYGAALGFVRRHKRGN